MAHDPEPEPPVTEEQIAEVRDILTAAQAQEAEQAGATVVEAGHRFRMDGVEATVLMIPEPKTPEDVQVGISDDGLVGMFITDGSRGLAFSPETARLYGTALISAAAIIDYTSPDEDEEMEGE